MTARILLIAAFLLSGCNVPPPMFMGVTPVRITVEHSIFDVRIKENRAHALRVNTEFAPGFQTVATRARIAIEQVSGCQVVQGSLTGDAIFITADLAC